MFKIFDNFSKIFGLKLNKSKCEMAVAGSQKGERVAFCGVLWIRLNEETIKILGIHFSYSKKLKKEKNFNNQISKIKNVLKVWRIRVLQLKKIL